MIGLALIGLTILWLLITAFTTRAIFRRLPEKRWRLPLVIGVYLLIVLLPVVDEILGGMQFHTLCKTAETVNVNEAKVKGRVVVLKEVPDRLLPGNMDIPRTSVPYAFVPIREDLWEYVDQQSGEILLSYKTYAARGGWLIRALGISEGSPLTFRGYCAPADVGSIFHDLDLRRADKTSEKKGVQR